LPLTAVATGTHHLDDLHYPVWRLVFANRVTPDGATIWSRESLTRLPVVRQVRLIGALMAIMFVLGLYPFDYVRDHFIVTRSQPPSLLGLGLIPIWLGVDGGVNCKPRFPDTALRLCAGLICAAVAPNSISTMDILPIGLPFPFVLCRFWRIALCSFFPASITVCHQFCT